MQNSGFPGLGLKTTALEISRQACCGWLELNSARQWPSMTPLSYCNMNRITRNVQVGVLEVNYAGMFPPGAELDTLCIDLTTFKTVLSFYRPKLFIVGDHWSLIFSAHFPRRERKKLFDTIKTLHFLFEHLYLPNSTMSLERIRN